MEGIMEGEPGMKTAGLADSLDGESRALTVSDIAELLNISERQVYKHAAEQRIPCFKNWRLHPFRSHGGCRLAAPENGPCPRFVTAPLRKTGY